MKRLLKVLLIISGTILVIICAGVGGLLFLLRPSHVEVASVPSPDGGMVASIIETNGGATTSFGYEVTIHNKNQIMSLSKDVAYLYGAARSDCADGVDLQWESDDVLLIRYFEAQKINLYLDKVKVGGRIVTVKLVPGVINTSAPCGSMEYSKKNNIQPLDCAPSGIANP